MRFRAEKTSAVALRAARGIYTVPPDQPFLTSLAEALVAGNLPARDGPRPGPMQLADTTLLVPTRRATQALETAFLKASGGNALLLPKVRPIFGAGDELALFAMDESGAAERASGPLRAISEVERQLVLAKLVLRWAEAQRGSGEATAIARAPAQAVRLARELARLMDAMEIEDVDYARMRTLVPDSYSEHWGRTIEFLKIVTEHWPLLLKEHGLESAMMRNKRLVEMQARRLRDNPPTAPVIVAGVMSSVPAVTQLVQAVIGLPNGALVLPALDQSLDEESWNAILPANPQQAAHPEHPQFGLRKMLAALGVPREDVQPLPGAGASQTARARLISEAMRPAGTTERWHEFTARGNANERAQALRGITVLDAPSAEEEAEVVALIMREVLETPRRTAALVSPDRLLARRVAARLAGWGVRVDDSAGLPFTATETGALLDLIIEAVATRFQPIALMSLLKHPLCRLGMPAETVKQAADALELTVFRSPYFGRGLGGVQSAFERGGAAQRAGTRQHQAVRRLSRSDWQLARELLKRLREALQPLEMRFLAPSKANLQELARAHTATAEALAKPNDESNGHGLWEGEAGEAAAKFFAALMDTELYAPAMAGADYPDFYRSLVAEERVRLRGHVHPRLSIWEPYESRLQQPDVVILGSLNEGTWPQSADPGPWLNRQMRKELGLPAPEERIGDAAHIFTSLLGAERVYLTRAAKVGGAPTVPSRWLLRLGALLGGFGDEAIAQPWLQWAQARNAAAGRAKPVRAPEPCPPVAMRPRKLSVTAVERWISNPYAIFAQRILKLEPLPKLGIGLDAATRGQIVHDALSRFAHKFPDHLPHDAQAELLALAQATLAELIGSPRVAGFWKPRFDRFAQWFAQSEPARRDGIERTLAEVEGAMVIEAPGGPFTLTARADRLDVGRAGLIITDYKTRASLDDLARRAGHGAAPQLPLEGAIAVAGGFTGLPAMPVAALRYISTSGGEPAGGEWKVNSGDVGGLVAEAEAGLARLIATFDNPAAPYRALRRQRFNYKYDEYAHLARVAEWQAQMPEDAE